MFSAVQPVKFEGQQVFVMAPPLLVASKLLPFLTHTQREQDQIDIALLDVNPLEVQETLSVLTSPAVK